MSMERLHQIKARLAAATPGPWEYISGRSNYPEEVSAGGVRADVFWIAKIESDGYEHPENDGQFIANAPADIEFLLAEVERLQKALNAADDNLRELADVSLAGGGCMRNRSYQRLRQAMAVPVV